MVIIFIVVGIIASNLILTGHKPTTLLGWLDCDYF